MPSDAAITQPTFAGFVDSTYDALVLFEACLQRRVSKITRRLHEKERHLINSGSIFVFDERESGIKRWTDNLLWSPSRILGNFLIYRELDKKETQSSANASASQTAADEMPTMLGNSDPSLRGGDPSTAISRERALLGSLTSSYKFKLNGLVKKTISVSGMHMICYYRVNDVVGGRLRSPSSLPELATLDISSQLLTNQNFRVPPKIDIGPDGKARYVGELEEAGANTQASLSVPSMSNRRRSSSADKVQPSRSGRKRSSESSEEATANHLVPMRPTNERRKSSSSQRYEPYLRSEQSQTYSMPINLQESSKRRNSHPWPLGHLGPDAQSSAYGQSAPSPVDSNSSGGYEIPQYATYQHMSSQPPADQYQATAYDAGPAFEDPLVAFRNYQVTGGQHAGAAKSGHYRQPPPLQQFPLPPENSSLRSTALRSPYYSQSPRSSPSYQLQYPSVQPETSMSHEDHGPTDQYPYAASAISPTHYSYAPSLVSPIHQAVPLPSAYPEYSDFPTVASSSYHASGLVAPAIYQELAPSREDGQPRQSFQDWSTQMAEAQWRGTG